MNHEKLTHILAFHNPYKQLIKAMMTASGIIAIMTGTHILYFLDLIQTTQTENLLFLFAGLSIALIGITLAWIPHLINYNNEQLSIEKRVIFSIAPYIVYGLVIGVIYHHFRVLAVIG